MAGVVMFAMVGWHSMDSGSTEESWIDGLDWTPVEVSNRVSLKVRQSCLVFFFLSKFHICSRFLVKIPVMDLIRVLR